MPVVGRIRTPHARLLRAISDRYSSHDFIGDPDVLTWLFGRRPTTFEEFRSPGPPP
jgi:hypothetical protein